MKHISKIIGSVLIVGTYLFLAFGSSDSKDDEVGSHMSSWPYCEKHENIYHPENGCMKCKQEKWDENAERARKKINGW